MEKIFRFFAERHLLATIFTLMILILGIVTTMTIRRDLFPRVELDQALITTVYPGASPEDVELNVTNKIETRLKSVSGIKELTSISIEDMSIIFVIPDPDLSKNAIDNVIQDIRESVSQVPRLPKGLLSPPVVSREKMSEIPILEVGIASDKMNYSELRESARIMEKKLKEINGVSKIEKYGYLAREIKIEIDPKKLEKFEVPLREIIYAIQSRNIRSTGGTLESYTGEKNIVALAQFRDPAEVGEVIVRSNFEGYALKVKNLASIKDGFKKEDVVSRINGKKMITFSINKRESADIVSTVNRIKDFLEKEKMDLPSHLEIHYSNDLSRYVTASFDVVFKNGLMGFFLVLIILTIFLSFRTSFWVALGIPVSLLGSIALLPLFGVGLDVITLTAMILVLGIIVDDAIIISETIYQRWEAGDSPVDAAVNGLKRVFLPVVTTILTTFLAFIPMFFIKGELGKFIYVIPLVITLALSISLLEGIIALPAHVANAMEKPGKKSLVDRLGWGWLLLLKDKYRLFLEKIVKPKEKKQDGTRDWFSSIRSKYEGFMHSVLKRRYYLASIFIALLVGSIIYAVAGLKIIVFPSEGAEEFVAYMETPIGTPVDKTSLAVKKVEDIVNTLSRDEVSSYMTLIGNQEGAVSQSHIAMIRINLTPFSTRSRNAEEIANELREKSLHLKDFSSFRFDVKESGPSPEKPVSIRIIGSNNELRKKLANDVEVYLKSISGVRDVTRDDKDGKEQVEILFDYAALARMGMTVIDAAQTIRVAYDGEVV
ncbi:MAG: efflux RND transporter permease subunit, partial [bacterium]|nr:efflux RND transporter permease subunit [bacterium]